MHQTFYIDIDEEITSIIERLKKARASEVIIVVPKRALLIQSIVNLRILKRQADDSGMQLMIVTQDKLGKILVEKAGIFVQQKMDNISDDEISMEEEAEEDLEDDDERSEIRKEAEQFQKGKSRLDGIGTDSYFDEEGGASLEKKNFPVENNSEKEGKEKLINKELVSGSFSDIRKKDDADKANFPKSSESDESILSSNNRIRQNDFAKTQNSPVRSMIHSSHPTQAPTPRPESSPASAQAISMSSVFPSDEKRPKNSFYQKSDNSEKSNLIKKKDFEEYNLSGASHRWFWAFGVVAVVVTLGVLAYFFVPSAQISLAVKTGVKSVDSEITGKIDAKSIEMGNGIIPAKIIEINQEVMKTYEATGKKSVSNQKARGKITIYNEYDKNPQSLVATTRFLTEDGKLFRLVNVVTVPGMSEKDGKLVSGSVEAQIVADQSGSEFNIEPTKFKIPGFENSGNDKYNKFYAESKEKMSGGGGGSDQVSFVTAEDVASAKATIATEVEQFIKEKIAESAGNDFSVLDGATEKEELVYKLSNSEGDVADSFNITVQIVSRSLVFSKKDLTDVVAEMISKSSGSSFGVDRETISFDFGKPNVDFSAGTIDIKFYASGKLNPDLDLEAIKGEILGKKEADLVAYLSNFSDIEKVKVNYQPSFLNSRIPFRKSQVVLGLDKE
jgi:hypothetical protein